MPALPIDKVVDGAFQKAPKFTALEESELNPKFANMTDKERSGYQLAAHELDHIAKFHRQVRKSFRQVHK
ncbi:uncharacterized protein N7484_002721 [Penicillium longicatenatum]|uniref:uncharacterized protein n=1 Tax=Penicillium longicatenatum TaxID=1561947 RepID=UPI002549B925|nr:uncharacterized protein N7484_002721 [Penicillium longicatenatum]KAJ5648998.1 hypothetical protein N7484_002721 [Penicillium longicatenatum]